MLFHRHLSGQLLVDLSRRGRKALFTVALRSAGTAKPYTFVLERKFGLFDAVNEHMGHLRVVHNNPDINGHGMKFDRCSWFEKKKGSDSWTLLAINQLYYAAGSSPSDKFSPSDSI
jgi:hypothetical protein